MNRLSSGEIKATLGYVVVDAKIVLENKEKNKMFDFMLMADNYEDRKVDNTVLDGSTVIDTCSVNDGHHPYETGILCPKYNHGEWVIVEAYDTKEEAQKGHNKWVGIMSSDKLPEKLVDCSNSFIQSFGNMFGLDSEFGEEF